LQVLLTVLIERNKKSHVLADKELHFTHAHDRHWRASLLGCSPLILGGKLTAEIMRSVVAPLLELPSVKQNL
jgi:hypothetical protein